jgi:hypothetical protein
VHHVTVKGGPSGYSDFIRDIQRIFGITAEHDMQLAFDCADPITGALPLALLCPPSSLPAPLRASPFHACPFHSYPLATWALRPWLANSLLCA